MHERSLVLKQDVLGRVRAPVERRAEMVAEFRRSGLSGAQFARLAGMKYPTLMAWVKRAAGPAPVVVGKRPSGRKLVLVEAVVRAGSGKPPPLVLQLGGGVRMELTEAGQTVLAAQLIQALRKLC